MENGVMEICREDECPNIEILSELSSDTTYQGIPYMLSVPCLNMANRKIVMSYNK